MILNHPHLLADASSALAESLSTGSRIFQECMSWAISATSKGIALVTAYLLILKIVR